MGGGGAKRPARACAHPVALVAQAAHHIRTSVIVTNHTLGLVWAYSMKALVALM